MKVKLTINKNMTILNVKPRFADSFIEHMERVIYEGIYQPRQATTNELDCRKSILNLVNELNMHLVRNPGRNFILGYN